MKQIKIYLNTQKELAYVAWSQSLQADNPNLFDAKHWLERIVHLELMLRDIENGEKKEKKTK
jgi:hypothetical protein